MSKREKATEDSSSERGHRKDSSNKTVDSRASLSYIPEGSTEQQKRLSHDPED